MLKEKTGCVNKKMRKKIFKNKKIPFRGNYGAAAP